MNVMSIPETEVDPNFRRLFSCDRPAHQHHWPTSGILEIERCEHYCLFCTGKKAKKHWSSAWFLRRHVRDFHVAHQFPNLIVAEGWKAKPMGNTRPTNKKQRAPGSNKKKAGTKKDNEARIRNMQSALYNSIGNNNLANTSMSTAENNIASYNLHDFFGNAGQSQSSYDTGSTYTDDSSILASLQHSASQSPIQAYTASIGSQPYYESVFDTSSTLDQATNNLLTHVGGWLQAESAHIQAPAPTAVMFPPQPVNASDGDFTFDSNVMAELLGNDGSINMLAQPVDSAPFTGYVASPSPPSQQMFDTTIATPQPEHTIDPSILSSPQQSFSSGTASSIADGMSFDSNDTSASTIDTTNDTIPFPAFSQEVADSLYNPYIDDDIFGSDLIDFDTQSKVNDPTLPSFGTSLFD